MKNLKICICGTNPAITNPSKDIYYIGCLNCQHVVTNQYSVNSINSNQLIDIWNGTTEIKRCIRDLEKFEKVNILVRNITDTANVFDYKADNQFVSASLIKIPIMLAALNYVILNGSLDEIIKIDKRNILVDSDFPLQSTCYCISELIVSMITRSDNTATNILIDFLGLNYINDYISSTLCLRSTRLERLMTDDMAIKEGKNNYTSLQDMWLCFYHLVHSNILDDSMCDFAINTLYNQEINNQLPKYVKDIKFAHKTGGLDYLNSDVGIFELNGKVYFIGISIYDTPQKSGDRDSVGKLAQIVYSMLNNNI